MRIGIIIEIRKGTRTRINIGTGIGIWIRVNG